MGWCWIALQESRKKGAPEKKEGDTQDGRARQGHRRAGCDAVDELGMQPFLEPHHRESGILSRIPSSDADQELLGDMVRASAAVEHALDVLFQHLHHCAVLVAARLVVCQRPPVAVERRERPLSPRFPSCLRCCCWQRRRLPCARTTLRNQCLTNLTGRSCLGLLPMVDTDRNALFARSLFAKL